MDDLVNSIKSLFTHKYDIDDLIAAMTSGKPHILHTTDGTVVPYSADVEEDSHTFIMQPMEEVPSTHEDRKKKVLDWLDDRNLIPPSMRHIREDNICGSAPKQPQNVGLSNAPKKPQKVKIDIN